MTDKGLGILCIAAVALVVVTALLYSKRHEPAGRFVAGTPLIQGLDPKNVHKIVIQGGADKVTLVRQGESFTVVEKNGYPGSAKEINDLMIKCQDIRTREKVTEDAKNQGELGVADGGKDATSVSFLGAKDAPLIGFITGKNAEGGAGVYVRLTGKNTVYRTEESLSVNTKPLDYMDKGLANVKRDDVKRVEVKAGKDSYAIARDEKDAIQLGAIPPGKRAKGTDYESVFDALSNLSLTDVLPGDKAEVTWDATWTAELKTHISYTVRLAKKNGEHYVKLSASFPDDVTITKPDAKEPPEELKRKAAVWEAYETAPRFTARHADWVYKVSSFDGERMRKPFGELIEDIPTTPDEITASHVLISYKGLENSTATRTKDEAKALAETVLKESQAPGADFAALAKKHSDDPGTKDKGGDLGSFKKGKMTPAFEEAAFKLKVGELSGVVESPFGFHVIKRTK